MRAAHVGWRVITVLVVTISVCLLSVVTTIPAIPATPASATPPSIPSVSAVTVIPAAVDLTGFTTARIQVRAHITSPQGQTRESAANVSLRDPKHLSFPFVRLQRVSGPWYLPSVDERSLTLMSGDLTDGEWEAAVSVPATYAGQWRVTAVCTQTPDHSAHCDDPHTGTLTVTGSDYPVIKVESRARAAGRFPWVRLTLLTSHTARPLPRRTLVLCLNISCDEVDPPRGLVLTTDEHGQVTPDTSALEYFGSNRVWLLASTHDPLEHNTAWQDVTVAPAQPFRFSAVIPRASTAREALTVTGSVFPLMPGTRVALQHWVNHSWRTVTTAAVRASGRYSVSGQPTTAGTHVYRVVKFSDRCDPFRCLLVGSPGTPQSVTVT